MTDANAADATLSPETRKHHLDMHKVYLANATDQFLKLGGADGLAPRGKVC